MPGQADICRFAGEYLSLYLTPETPAHTLSARFAEECTELGFVADDGTSFLEAFPEDAPLTDTADFLRIAPHIRDVSLLGGAIFSHFRHVMVWEGPEALTLEAHRTWFAAALSRLMELTGPSESRITLFPAVRILREEISRLRGELTDLLAQHGQLLLQTIPNLDAEYQVAFGSLEYEIYSAECSVRRLRRKMELIRARLNTGTEVDLEETEALLDEEFARYQAVLKEQMNRYASGLARYNAETLSPEQTARLRRLFCRTVKALHPDLHPDQGAVEADLYVQACHAYNMGDLEALESIYVLVESGKFDEEIPAGDDLSALHEEKMRLLKHIEGVTKAMDDLKEQYPYCAKELLRDPEARKIHTEELRAALREMREREKYYEDELQALLGTIRVP